MAADMAQRIRAREWSASLGAPAEWPQALRAGIDLMLDTRHAAFIAWGDKLVTIYNDAAANMLGSTHPNALGMPFRQLFAESWTELEPLSSATLRGEAQYLEDRALPLPGRAGHATSWYSLSFTPLRDVDGAIRGFFCVVVDTTARVLASQAKRQQEQAARRASDARYRTLFNCIDEGFCVIEVAFDEEGKAADYRFLETNPAFEHQTGLTNATGKWMRALVPLHEQHWFDSYGRVARTGEQSRFVEHARSLGRWFNVFAFRVGAAGQNQVAMLISDITERVETDQALRAADRRKDEFLATLAHELRNPLAPLRNGLQIARRCVAEPTLQRTLDMMDRQLSHLVRLVDDLLDVGRISSGKMELHREPLLLSNVIAGSIEAARVCVEGRQHQLTIEGDAAHLYVLGDSHRLMQVFTNLLSNACKYTDPGGDIRVLIRRQGGDVVVQVTDNGIGIPPSETGRVFQLFSQVRAHQPLHAGGLGIGLSLVRSLVSLHGGSVEATSAGTGRGSTFTVQLPLLRDAPLGKPAPADEVSPQARPKRVVVADDNADAVSTLAEMLRMQGHQVWVANDGAEAVEQAHSHHPDAILLDLGMPRIDGLEAARRIRAMPGGEEPLIVALTGWGQHADRERTHAAGFDVHLVKPADPEEIVGLIERGRAGADANQATQ
ncbi:MAG TPA: ATP-binding protein [Steroidobacteraceae bacterium]|nr:ATP-binding protein [Steroidobacteraceae bacterium]